MKDELAKAEDIPPKSPFSMKNKQKVKSKLKLSVSWLFSSSKKAQKLRDVVEPFCGEVSCIDAAKRNQHEPNRKTFLMHFHLYPTQPKFTIFKYFDFLLLSAFDVCYVPSRIPQRGRRLDYSLFLIPNFRICIYLYGIHK